jgi:hAT family C-terminal dimerisation region
MTDWRRYCRVEIATTTTPEKVFEFWEKRSGQFSDLCRFLVSIPPTSAEVERSFSLAGCVDTKLRHALPDESRRLTAMLLFNGDVESRFT